MDGGSKRRGRAPRAQGYAQWFGLTGAFLLALGGAGCNSTTMGPVGLSMSGPTIAFESIDGPPESIYGKLVKSLSEEANARQIAVVSRGTPAQYRIRIYAANIVYSKRSVVQWVWDVYDANQQRTRRLSGEEPVTGAGRTTWAAADDQLVRQIARAGMDRLVAFLGAQPREPAAPQPAPSAGPAVALAAER